MFQNKYAQKVERKLTKFIPKRTQTIKGEEAIVSFSFDDFPTSAMSDAGPILAEFGMTASYYLAGGLMGKKNDDMPICDKELVRKTSDAGHEIGCHTYGHLSCQAASLEELQNDLSRNEEIIKNITNIVPSSFAYPFGKVSFSSRTLIGQRFSVARGIHEGLNSGKTDLLNLKANAIYSNVFSKEKYIALLQQAKKEGGWLIFYTHDVTARPGKFGCTPEEFQTVVNLVAEAGVRVLPVKHAAGYFAFQK